MNPTIEKFGFPVSLLKELRHWLVLVRPAQVTLGSLVLAAKSEATAYSQLDPEAFAEQADAVSYIEQTVSGFVQCERINYLMLMMVDRHVHFHVIPRYSSPRTWKGIEFADDGWPGPPRLDGAVKLEHLQLSELVAALRDVPR